MEKGYQIKSLIGEVANGIDSWLAGRETEVNVPILLYGLDTYSFAMRTILEHRAYSVAGYISENASEVVRKRRDLKDFACRYLSSDRDLLSIDTVKERLCPFDDDVAILIASNEYVQIKQKLELLGYVENIHFFKIYDFVEPELDKVFKENRSIPLEEMQVKEKEILEFVDSFCNENNLRYWVCGGTLLGTIRHKGFIPWDDDIDIFLPWEDYLKLIQIFPKDGKYHLIGMGASDDNDFSDVFAKVVVNGTLVEENVGSVKKLFPLWIDIFPLIGLPSDDDERHEFFVEYKELDKSIWQDFYKNDGKLNVFSEWYPKQKELLGRYDFDNAAYVGVFGTVYGEKDCTTKKVYKETIRMPFENITVNVPVGFKEYLDNLYGKDWMQLPDESKRKPHHNIRTCWLKDE